MSLRLALPTRCFPGPLKATLRTFAEREIRGAQFDVGRELKPGEFGESGLRQFRHLLAEYGVAVASCAIPLRKPLHDEVELERRVDAIRSGMTLAYQLGTNILTARTGAIPDPESQPHEWQVLVDVLSDLTAYGNHVGITLCLTVAPNPPKRLRKLLETVVAGPLGLNFDPVVCRTAGSSPADVLREFHAAIGSIRARDAERDIDGEVEETDLGRGDVDWAELLALLHEIEYAGWIVLDRTSGDDKPSDLFRGVRYLRNLMPF